jgi:hypothetical protein
MNRINRSSGHYLRLQLSAADCIPDSFDRHTRLAGCIRNRELPFVWLGHKPPRKQSVVDCVASIVTTWFGQVSTTRLDNDKVRQGDA